jgi:hypothetical protein
VSVERLEAHEAIMRLVNQMPPEVLTRHFHDLNTVIRYLEDQAPPDLYAVV